MSPLELDTYKSHIRTTKIRSQIAENFVVHETEGYHDTLNYLKRLHSLVVRKYQGRDIYVYPSNQVESISFDSMQQMAKELYPSHRFHLDMVTVRTLATKSQSLTYRDIYLKQLTRIRGVSAMKAIQIAEKYPTIRSLFEAYNQCMGEEYKKNMLASLPSFGNQLSAKIYKFFCLSSSYEGQ